MLQYIRSKYAGYGIARKILAMLLLVSILPIILIEIVTCSIGANAIQSQTDELMISNMNLAQKSLEDYLSVYDHILLSVYSQNDYAVSLEKLNVWDSRKYYAVKNELETDLQNIAYAYPNIKGIAVVTRKREIILYDTVTLSKENSFCFPREDAAWKAIAEETFSSTQTVYSEAVRRTDTSGQERNVLYIAHRLADINNYSKGTVGSIMICLDEKDVREVYQREEPDEFHLSFLCSAAGKILSCSRESFIGTDMMPDIQEDTGYARSDQITPEQQIKETALAKGMIDTKRCTVYIQPLFDGQFLQVNIQDTDNLLVNVRYIAEIIILIGLLTLIASCIAAIRFANNLQGSVQQIIQAMDKAYKGDYEVQINSQREDEFGKISRHFNHMVQKINHSGRQEKEALLREKNAEIKALEAQINPHFLYNTLDAINWVAIDNEQFQISKMLKDLAIILRYSIHKSNEMVSVASELEYLKKYIYLQQQRFEFSFQCFFDIDETVLEYDMHKLLFQPLIENAIVHGFPGKSGQDSIRISIRRLNEMQLEIRVEDNGSGMTAEQVEIFEHFDEQDKSAENSIGVKNVMLRMRYYYGEKGYFHIDSGEAGTTVILRIPYQ